MLESLISGCVGLTMTLQAISSVSDMIDKRQ